MEYVTLELSSMSVSEKVFYVYLVCISSSQLIVSSTW